jgi:excisionase family DNA binding protein
MAEQLLSARGIAAKLGVSRSTVYRMVQREALPRPIKLRRLSRWRESDVEHLLRRRGLDRPRR